MTPCSLVSVSLLDWEMPWAGGQGLWPFPHFSEPGVELVLGNNETQTWAKFFPDVGTDAQLPPKPSL